MPVVLLLPVLAVVGEIAIRLRVSGERDWSRLTSYQEPDAEQSSVVRSYLPGLLFRARPGRLKESNFLGFRDEEFDVPKPERVFRVVVLGDSMAAGSGLDSFDAPFPKVAQALLRRAYPRLSIEVLNLGIGGYDVVQVRTVLARLALPRLDPDLVVYAHFNNDLVRLSYLDRSSGFFRKYPNRPFREGTPEQKPTRSDRVAYFIETHSYLAAYLSFRSDLVRYNGVLPIVARLESSPLAPVARILERTSSYFIPCVRMTENFARYRLALEDMAGMCAARGTPFLVAAVPLLSWPMAELESPRDLDRLILNAINRERPNVPVRFLADGLPPETDTRTIIQDPRDPHPNARGHALLGQALADAIAAQPAFERFVAKAVSPGSTGPREDRGRSED